MPLHTPLGLVPVYHFGVAMPLLINHGVASPPPIPIGISPEPTSTQFLSGGTISPSGGRTPYQYQHAVSGWGLKDLGLTVSGPLAEVRRGGTIWSSWDIKRDFPYRVGGVSLPADK